MVDRESEDPAKSTPPPRSRTPFTLSRKANHSLSEFDNSFVRGRSRKELPDLKACSDPKGRALSGEHRYTITFDLNDMPPVTEFWEIPLYDREGYFYDNPIDRYSINSYMLKRGKLHTADGGASFIYIQSG